MVRQFRIPANPLFTHSFISKGLAPQQIYCIMKKKSGKLHRNLRVYTCVTKQKPPGFSLAAFHIENRDHDL